MRLLNTRAEREAVKGSVTVWRPWQLKQLELFQGVAVSTPSHQCLTQEYLIVWGQSGTADIRYRNTRVSGPVADGTFSVREPGEIWISHLKDVTYHHLFIDPAWLQQFVTEMLHWEKGLPHFPSHPLFDPSLSRALRDLAARSQAPVSRLQQEEALLSLFAPLLHVHAEEAGALPRLGWEQPAIKRAKDYLQEHYAEEVSLQELARLANLSPSHFSSVFRQTVGLPPHAYQIRLRLVRARTLLAQGYESGYVASETGFYDQSHFTQQFKHHYMMTPANYRKTARFS